MDKRPPTILHYSSPEPALGVNGLAIASVVCGSLLALVYLSIPHRFSSFRGHSPLETALLLLWIVSGGMTLILAALGIKQENRWRTGGRMIAGIGFLLGVANIIAMPLIVRHETQRSSYWYGVFHARGYCQSNLRQIGLTILMYSAENEGRFPESYDQKLWMTTRQ